MNTQFLIDSIMRHTTVLIAQLATAGGVRAPLSRIADQVFLDLARELERHGVSRKVSADMFGMALRAYLKKIQRLSESTTDRGRSLWQAVFGFVADRPVVSRHEVLRRFHRDDIALVRGVLRDLTESGLLFASGSGAATVYRAVGDEEVGYMRGAHEGSGADELLWAVIYREGPLGRDALASRAGAQPRDVDACLERLQLAGRIKATPDGRYAATEFHVSRESGVGLEAALFDHYHALVATLCCRLNPDPELELPDDGVGGSTYTFDVWPGHPVYDEVIGVLRRYRVEQNALRQRVEHYNQEHGLPARYQQVVAYAGQCVLSQAEDDHDD